MELMHTHIAGCFEARATPLDNPANTTDVVWEDEAYESRPVRVTDQSAQTFAPWWRALNVIANDVAQLPLVVFKRLTDDGRTRDNSHPSYKLLHRRPNREMGPFTFKHLMQMRCLSWGNSYAYIERAGADCSDLWPLDSQSVTPFRVNGELFYDWTDESGRRETLFPDEVFHLRGPGDDGLSGKSMFKLAKESLEVGMQAQRFGSRFFKNDAKPGVVLEFPNPVDEPTAKNILKNWERRHGGASNAARPGFLDRGGKVSQFSMSNDDAQFLETREFSKAEIADWFVLPPHKVGDLRRATFSNIEQQSIEYVVYSLMPWLVRWQDECNAKLFRPSEIEAESHYAEFIVEALLRGDYLTQMQGDNIGLTSGIYNHDEVRARRNLNRIPNELGQTFYYSQNMTPMGTVRSGTTPGQPAEPEPVANPRLIDDDGKSAARSMFSVLLVNEVSRAYQRIGKGATQAASTPGRLQAWLEKSLAKECREIAATISKASEHAVLAGIGGVESEEIQRSIHDDFWALLDDASRDAADFRAEVETVTKRMAADRPAELVAELWSQ